MDTTTFGSAPAHRTVVRVANALDQATGGALGRVVWEPSAGGS